MYLAEQWSGFLFLLVFYAGLGLGAIAVIGAAMCLATKKCRTKMVGQ